MSRSSINLKLNQFQNDRKKYVLSPQSLKNKQKRIVDRYHKFQHLAKQDLDSKIQQFSSQSNIQQMTEPAQKIKPANTKAKEILQNLPSPIEEDQILNAFDFKKFVQFKQNSRRNKLKEKLTQNWFQSRHFNCTKDEYLHSPEEMIQYRGIQKIFELFDTNHSHTLDIREMLQMFRKYNINLDLAKLKQLFETINKDSSQALNLKEFKACAVDESAKEEFGKCMRILRDQRDEAIQQNQQIHQNQSLSGQNQMPFVYIPNTFTSLINFLCYKELRDNKMKGLEDQHAQIQDKYVSFLSLIQLQDIYKNQAQLQNEKAINNAKKRTILKKDVQVDQVLRDRVRKTTAKFLFSKHLLNKQKHTNNLQKPNQFFQIPDTQQNNKAANETEQEQEQQQRIDTQMSSGDVVNFQNTIFDDQKSVAQLYKDRMIETQDNFLVQNQRYKNNLLKKARISELVGFHSSDALYDVKFEQEMKQLAQKAQKYGQKSAIQLLDKEQKLKLACSQHQFLHGDDQEQLPKQKKVAESNQIQHLNKMPYDDRIIGLLYSKEDEIRRNQRIQELTTARHKNNTDVNDFSFLNKLQAPDVKIQQNHSKNSFEMKKFDQLMGHAMSGVLTSHADQRFLTIMNSNQQMKHLTQTQTQKDLQAKVPVKTYGAQLYNNILMSKQSEQKNKKTPIKIRHRQTQSFQIPVLSDSLMSNNGRNEGTLSNFKNSVITQSVYIVRNQIQRNRDNVRSGHSQHQSLNSLFSIKNELQE